LNSVGNYHNHKESTRKKINSVSFVVTSYKNWYIKQNIIKPAKRYADERLADRSEKPALRQAQDRLGSL